MQVADVLLGRKIQFSFIAVTAMTSWRKAQGEFNANTNN
jgi:hypothetical protein